MPGTLGVQQPDALQTGVITTAGGPTDPSSYVSISCGDGYSTWSADLRGTFSAGTTIVFEVCLDGINWVPAAGAPVGSTSPALVQSITGAGPKDYTGTSAAMQQFRVRATAIQGGDAVKVVLRLSIATASSLSTGGGGGGSVQITDGVHGPAEVVPGSTAPLVTDDALEVVLRPDSVVNSEPVLPTVPRLASVAVSVSASGNNTLVAGVALQTIRVFKLFLVFSTAGTATFQDGGSTALDGVLTMTAGGAIVLDLDTEPWFLTSAGNDFVLNLGTGGLVGGRVYYTQS